MKKFFTSTKNNQKTHAEKNLGKEEKKSELFGDATLRMLVNVAKNPKNKISVKAYLEKYMPSIDVMGKSVKYTIKAEDGTTLFSIEEIVWGSHKQYVLKIDGKDCTGNVVPSQLAHLAEIVKLESMTPRENKQTKEQKVIQFLSEHTVYTI